VAVLNFFLHNWADLSELETFYSTDIMRSATSLAEDRRGLLSKPQRVLSLSWLSVTRAEAQRFLQALFRMQQESVEVPLYMDQSLITSPSAGTTLNCSTVDRRFFVGQKVLATSFDGQGRPTNTVVGEILTVAAGVITTVASMGTHPVGDLVFPIIDTHVMLEGEITAFNDFVGRLSLSFREVEGANAIPVFLALGLDPPGFPIQQSLPVLITEFNLLGGMRTRVVRHGVLGRFGRGFDNFEQGPRALVEQEFRFLLETRAEAFQLLKFFDSRRGRLFPFFIAFPHGIWEVTAIGVTTLDITATGNFSDLEDFTDYVAIVEFNGTTTIRLITSFVDNGATWRINVVSFGVPPLLSDINRAGPAHLSRMAKDSMVESWNTDQVCQITLTTREMVNEKTVTPVDL